jgi:hypothetical protein
LQTWHPLSRHEHASGANRTANTEQNAEAERVIGSIRRECLDQVIVVNAAGLHRVLTAHDDPPRATTA